jgi:hypothetical protein
VCLLTSTDRTLLGEPVPRWPWHWTGCWRSGWALLGVSGVMREFRREALWMALEEEYRNLLHEKGLRLPQAKAIQTLHAVASSADVASR